jgi:hypothetical protein
MQIHVTYAEIRRLKTLAHTMPFEMHLCIGRHLDPAPLISPETISVLVHDALGTPGTLSDALDVLEDRGVVHAAIFGTLATGGADAVLLGAPYQNFPKSICCADQAGEPVPRFQDLTKWHNQVVFRTGARCRLVGNDNDIFIHPDDVESVRDRWYIGPANARYPVVFPDESPP